MGEHRIRRDAVLARVGGRALGAVAAWRGGVTGFGWACALILASALLASARPAASATPTDLEQYLLEVVNRARANPQAEADALIPSQDLNEGPPDTPITAAPKQPLAMNELLLDAARGHSQWMLDSDTFAHLEVPATDTYTPTDRIDKAGYTWFSAGENIGFSGTTGSLDAVLHTDLVHEGLFEDSCCPGRGHRVNLMEETYREAGFAVVIGVFSTTCQPSNQPCALNAPMITQNFAHDGESYFFTGVFYDDLDQDEFYSLGEGLGDVVVEAVRRSDSATFQTTTWPSGGYSLAVPDGIYDLTASGGDLAGVLNADGVQMAQRNVRPVFVPEPAGAAVAVLSIFALRLRGRVRRPGRIRVSA